MGMACRRPGGGAMEARVWNCSKDGVLVGAAGTGSPCVMMGGLYGAWGGSASGWGH